MKTLKTLLSVFAMAAVFSAGTYAQTANVAVTADVNAAIVLTPTAVALGTIQTGSASIIDANSNDDAIESNIGSTASAGALQIDGESAANVVVEWTNATLDTSPASDAITFTPSVWLGASELTTPAGSTVAIAGGSITLDVGGELAAPSGTGSYSTANGSPIAFTVTYE